MNELLKAGIPFDLKPTTDIVYPPFKNGLYIEEYFDKYWTGLDFPGKDAVVYLDVYWHNVFHLNGGLVKVMSVMRKNIEAVCERAAREGKRVFTVCQWDDLFMEGKKPNNLTVFSVGNTFTVPLPLMVEDRRYTLQRQARIPFDKKTLLCSFVGSATHPVRHRVVEVFRDVSAAAIRMRTGWNIQVPMDHCREFIELSQQSKFGLAPRGYGPSSFRFFELMEMGVVPVYIHDGENALPYQEFLDYSRFSVVIHVNDLSGLPGRLAAIGKEDYERMLIEMERVRPWFSMEGMCDYIRRSVFTIQGLCAN